MAVAVFATAPIAEAHYRHINTYELSCAAKYNGTKEVKCYIKRAADQYHQDQSRALYVAWCESRFKRTAWNFYKTYHKGIYQFDWATWVNGPWGKGHSRYNPKYSALNAMWYWHKGEYSRWSCA